MSARRRLSSESGFSIIELLVSSAIMLTVTAAIFSMLNPAQGTAQAQPEVADLQQRMRIGADTLFKELMMAGAGTYQGDRSGSLINYFAPVLPRRIGQINPDASTVAEPDRITMVYVPNSYSQTTIENAMPPSSVELKVHDVANCPGNSDVRPLCGFEQDMNVMIFDESGHFDTFTITRVQDAAGHLQHRGQNWQHQYEMGSTITQVVSYTYYRNAETNQLMRYDGAAQDIALVDNVVDLQFEYFGDINPPTKPQPPIGSGIANCLYDGLGNYTAAMPVLAADEGSLAKLPLEMLKDGPMCGSGTNEFDADLLRIRKLRVILGMQVASPSLRAGKAVSSERLVPDYYVRFDITPRNLNLTR